jgi:tetratricopeptide (TPR) repeat protein
MIKKFPKILFTVMTIGYIFAIFSLFVPGKYIYGLISLAIAGVINLLYISSREYKASINLNKAKKLIEKNKIDLAASLIIKASQYNEDENAVNNFFSKPFKNKEAIKATLIQLSSKLKEYDTPYFRYIIAGFYYTSGDLKEVVQILKNIPEEKRTIKMVRLLGSALFDLKEIDKSLDALSEFDPPYPPMSEDELAIVYGIGIDYLTKGDKEKAMEYLNKVEARNPKFGNVSKILEQLGEEEEPN